MAGNGELTTAQFIGWGVTATGIVLSLGWNLLNHFRTGWIADRLRREQYRANQWERVRGKIEEGTNALVSVVKTSVQQARALEDNQISGASIEVFNQIIVDAQDELASALDEASNSPYCEGHRWADLANGPSSGTETAWDVILQKLAAAQAASTKAERLQHLGEMRKPANDIRGGILDRCRAQDILIDPSKKL